MKISSTGESTVIANLENKKESVTNKKSNGAGLFSQKVEANGLAANADMTDVKDAAVGLSFYGILGAASVAFFALLILFWKK